MWRNSAKASSENHYPIYKNETTVTVYDSKLLEYADLAFEKKYNPEIKIIEYKAKGENMTQQEEMKQKLHENALDIAVAIGVFTRGTLTVESDLQEAKSSAKKLIENIDEYLESLKSKFNVGDYVTVYVNGKEKITKIDKMTENNSKAHGLWYDRKLVNIKQDYWFPSGLNKFRHATPEEIAEYKVALNFHEHGRKPFEVKEGDLIRTPNEKNTLIQYPENYTKEDFLGYGWEFLKTVEEVNEWLENK